MAKILLEAGSEVNMKSNSGHTPLHLAAQTGKTDLIELIVRYGSSCLLFIVYLVVRGFPTPKNSITVFRVKSGLGVRNWFFGLFGVGTLD